MKNVVIVVLFAAALGLGGFCLHQRSQLAQLQSRLATTETQLKTTLDQLSDKSEADAKISYAEKKAEVLQDTLTQTSAAAAKQAEQMSQLERSAATAKTNSGSGFGAMLKDPAMRDMIKTQQKAFMGPMIDKTYASLFQQLNLTPEQSAYVKDLLQKKMLAAADMGMSMFDEGADSAKRADLAKQVKSETDAIDEQIKQYLGDDNYKQVQSYEKTIADRMVVSQFHDQVAGSNLALNSEQEQQLIQAMQEERSGFKWTTDYNNHKPGEANFTEMFSEDRLNTFAEEQARFNQQVLARVKPILTADQLTRFETFQRSQTDMQIAGMKMAARMFGTQNQ